MKVQNLVPHLPGLDKDKIYVISGNCFMFIYMGMECKYALFHLLSSLTEDLFFSYRDLKIARA